MKRIKRTLDMINGIILEDNGTQVTVEYLQRWYDGEGSNKVVAKYKYKTDSKGNRKIKLPIWGNDYSAAYSTFYLPEIEAMDTNKKDNIEATTEETEVIEDNKEVVNEQVKIALPENIIKRIESQLSGDNSNNVSTKEFMQLLSQYIPYYIDINNTSQQDIGITKSYYQNGYIIIEGKKFIESYNYAINQKKDLETKANSFKIEIINIDCTNTQQLKNYLNQMGSDGYILDKNNNLVLVKFNCNKSNFYINGKSWKQYKNKILKLIFFDNVRNHTNELECWNSKGYHLNTKHANQTIDIIKNKIKEML